MGKAELGKEEGVDADGDGMLDYLSIPVEAYASDAVDLLFTGSVMVFDTESCAGRTGVDFDQTTATAASGTIPVRPTSRARNFISGG